MPRVTSDHNANLTQEPILTIAETLSTQKSAMKAEELASLLNCHKSKIYQMVKTNKIPHFMVGSMLRFDPGEISKWLSKKTA